MMTTAIKPVPPINPSEPLAQFNPKVTKISEPRTKLGTVVVTVARIFVPNCSDAILTNKAQNPVARPSANVRK